MKFDEDKILVQIGNRVRLLREENNLTQAQLASDVGRDQQNIQRLESGKYNPSVKYLKEICVGLEISIKDFFTEIDS